MRNPAIANNDSGSKRTRFRFKANTVPVETEQMPAGSTCGRCSVVKWPSWRPGHLTGYDIFAQRSG